MELYCQRGEKLKNNLYNQVLKVFIVIVPENHILWGVYGCSVQVSQTAVSIRVQNLPLWLTADE